MIDITLTVLGQAIDLRCAPEEERRLRDLGAALEARLAAFGGDSAGVRRLALTALSLLDEVQAAHAALVRAQGEVERLTDMMVDERLGGEPIDADRGRVSSLRTAQGSA